MTGEDRLSGSPAAQTAWLPPEVEAKLERRASGAAAAEEDGPDGARRTDPLSFVVGAIGGLRNAVLPIAAVIYSMRDEAYVVPVAIAVGLGVFALNAVISYLSWRRLTYRVGDADIRVESGILSRAARSVPYERIQDVSLEQALIPRLLGLVEVRFETGAGGSDELKLAYLKEAEGERLRETVRDRRDAAESGTQAAMPADGSCPEAGEAAGAEAAQPARTLFAMPPRRVFTFGMFEFSLAVMAVLAGLVQQFDFLLPFDIWELDEWRDTLGVPGDRIAALGPVAQVAGFLAALAGLIVLGVVSGLVRTTLREWGFVLERTPKGFRRRRGLLTRTDTVMPVHRVQALIVGTKLIRRRFGWHSLKFVSLAQDSGNASHVVAPFAQLEEIDPIVREAGFAPAGDDADWFAASGRFRLDRAVLRSIVLLIVAGALAFTPRPALALIPLALAALVALTEFMRWKTTRFAVDTQQLYTREYWLAPRRRIAKRVKLHSAGITQGPIARRRGYATLVLGLAGGSLTMPGLPIERARAVRRAVVDSMTATDFSRIEAAGGGPLRDG